MVAGLVLLAVNLRAAITSVSPVLDGLRDTLGLSGAAAGFLTTLPVLCLGGFATLAPPLARRFGAEATLIGALSLIAGGVLLRAVPSALPLFAGTAMAGAGIAIGNVLVPYVVKRSFPHRIGLFTGLATMLMASGAAVAAAATFPIQAATGSRPAALAAWALPAVLAVPVWVLLAVRRYAAGRAATRDAGRADGTYAAGAAGGVARTGSGGSLLRDPLAWHVTGFMGMQSLTFYVLVSWLPAVLGEQGIMPATAGLMLSMVLLLGIPTGLVMPLVAARMRRQGPLIVAVTACTALGVGGLLVAPGAAWLWTAIAGAGTGAAFPIAITLISLRAPDSAAAARLSGMAQTAGYLLASTGPLTIGLLRDLTGEWTVPLVVVLVLIVPQAVLGWLAGRDRLVRPRGVPVSRR